MVAWAPPPSPEGAGPRCGAAPGVAEAARRVLVPLDAPAALPRPFAARLRLNRLRRVLRREGWEAERRFDETLPLLRVYAPGLSCFGDSVAVVGVDGEWWYRSSTGDLLAPCARVDLAVSGVAALLVPWVSAAASSRRTGAD